MTTTLRQDEIEARAARAMLAALKLVKADPSASMLSSATWNDIKVVIAQAEAAGIKVTT